MMRNVYLQGDLGEQFGSKFRMHADSTQEIIKCINANRPEFKNYLVECDKNDIGFTVEYQNKKIEDEDILVPLEEGDVTIAILPAGSKSGLGKILAAVFLAFVVLPMIGTAYLGSATTAQLGALSGAGNGLTMSAAMATMGGKAVAMLAVNLAMTGINQIMAPDPSVDTDSPENYAFNGGSQNIKSGDPIPILYGELRVPGRPISLDVLNGSAGYTGTIVDGAGSHTTVSNNSGNYGSNGRRQIQRR
jgi:predicted phage tail protein